MEPFTRSRNRNRNHNQGRRMMGDMPENLLIEILHRLPLESAKKCMLVCKLWYSVMSTPYFAKRFVEINYSSTFLIPYYYRFYCDRKVIPKVFIPSKKSIFKYGLFSYLPNSEDVELVACCQDLVLGRSKTNSICVYYICNPLSQRWIHLPPSPLFGGCGFVFDGSGSSFRYAVIIISYGRGLHIFTSDSARWSKKDFSDEMKGLPNPRSEIVSNKGMLFWIAEGDVLIVMDPFSEHKSFWLIDLPPSPRVKDERFNFYINRELLVYNGNLRVYDIVHYYAVKELEIHVWELNNNGNGGEWCLKHDITCSCLVYPSRVICELACDPNDGNSIIYLLCYNKIVSYNIQKKTFDVICEYGKFVAIDRVYRAFLYEFPWLPTSIQSG